MAAPRDSVAPFRLVAVPQVRVFVSKVSGSVRKTAVVAASVARSESLIHPSSTKTDASSSSFIRRFVQRAECTFQTCILRRGTRLPHGSLRRSFFSLNRRLIHRRNKRYDRIECHVRRGLLDAQRRHKSPIRQSTNYRADKSQYVRGRRCSHHMFDRALLALMYIHHSRIVPPPRRVELAQ